MNIILGVSGSIAAYRAVDLLKFLQDKGHQLTVVLTANATQFISPLTFETFVGQRVFSSMFAGGQDPLLHINLAAGNEVLLVAPATANIIGKFASGIADDLLSTIFIAFQGKTFIAPAMHPAMYQHPLVQRNLSHLQASGAIIIEPESGKLACGAIGKGKLASFEKIYEEITKQCFPG